MADDIEIIGGPFAGLPAVVVSRSPGRIEVLVTVFGRETPVTLEPGQVAEPESAAHWDAWRAGVIRQYERLTQAEEFGFFLQRVGEPETDLAAEWDEYVVHRAAVRVRVEALLRAALERFDEELRPLPIAEARAAIDADPQRWSPGDAAYERIAEQYPEPPRPTPEELLHAAIFGEEDAEEEGEEEDAEPPVSPSALARDRHDRAERAAADRDYEAWEAGRTGNFPARGNPLRYAYATAERRELSLPPDATVELAIRSESRVPTGPIPQEAFDRISGLSLELCRATELSPLGRLRNLQWLSVRSSVPIDVAALAAAVREAPALSQLTIEGPVRDIGPLATLKQVRHLWLEHTEVTDVSALSRLTGLDDLSISDGPLSDIAPLADLNLGRLFLYRTRVTDLAPIAGMEGLQVLALSGCPVRDISVVATLPHLRHLNLGGRSPIAGLDELRAQLPDLTIEGVRTEAPQADPVLEYGVAPPVGDERAAALVAGLQALDGDHERWPEVSRHRRSMLAGRRLDLVHPLVDEHWWAARATVVAVLFADGPGSVRSRRTRGGFRRTPGCTRRSSTRGGRWSTWRRTSSPPSTSAPSPWHSSPTETQSPCSRTSAGRATRTTSQDPAASPSSPSATTCTWRRCSASRRSTPIRPPCCPSSAARCRVRSATCGPSTCDCPGRTTSAARRTGTSWSYSRATPGARRRCG
jgi:hypothetical protein